MSIMHTKYGNTDQHMSFFLLFTFAGSEDSDEPVHVSNLAGAFHLAFS